MTTSDSALESLWVTKFISVKKCGISMVFGGSVTSLKRHIWVWPGSGWSYQGFRQILGKKIIVASTLMMLCKENKYEIKFCIICGVNQTIGGGRVTSLSSPFWVYLGSVGGGYQRWNWLAWKIISSSIMRRIVRILSRHTCACPETGAKRGGSRPYRSG